jgi:signal transduction histidine kinase
VEASIASVRLQDDFASLHPQLNQRTDGVAPWLLYANDKWLLTLDPEGNLLVLDAQEAAGHAARMTALSSRGFSEPTLSSSSTPANRFLGPQFTGTYARMDRLDIGAKEPMRLRMAFIALSALLVIGLLTMGVVLIWRDSRRDMETARLRSDFVSSVSHELKTPLTSIRMYAETLRLRRQDDDVRDEYLDTIVSESGRLTRLLNNVLDFARIEKGTQRFNKATIELQSVVETGLEALNQTIVADGFVMETNLPSDPIMVDADPDALEQVVLNLISNALKYSGSARQVAVSVGRNGTIATLEVQDRGVGIASEDLPHLFEPYFRAQREDGPRISGTGLGLSIVKHSVDAHGGSIAVDSEPGHGTRVTVTLPMA